MAKQSELPGVGRKQIPELEAAAEKLRALRTQRQALAASEETAQAELKDLCKIHKVTKARPYIFETEDGDEMVKLDVLVEKPEERAYVRRHKEPKADEDEDGEEEGEQDAD
jgi:hypothetical protein